MSTRMGLCLRFRSKKNKYRTIVHLRRYKKCILFNLLGPPKRGVCNFSIKIKNFRVLTFLELVNFLGL